MKKVKLLLVLLAMFSLTSFVFAGTPMVVENAAGESVELPVSFGGLFAMVVFTSLVFGATIVFHDNINNYLGNIKLGERNEEKRVRCEVPLWCISFLFVLLFVLVIINPEKHVSNYEKLLLLYMQLTIFFGALGIYAYRFRERVRIKKWKNVLFIYVVVYYDFIEHNFYKPDFESLYVLTPIYCLLIVAVNGLPMGFRFIKNLIEKKKKTS